MANKAIKYRIYPNKEQRDLILKTFGCSRFVYNYMLEESIKAHENGESLCTRNSFNYLLPKLGKVKASLHRIPKKGWKLKAATILQSSDGKFYASVLHHHNFVVAVGIRRN